MSKRNANLLILLAAILYGSGFVVARVASDFGFSPSSIVFIRGAIFTVLMAVWLGKEFKIITRKDLIMGCVIGIFNFGGFYFQITGLEKTSPANNAFLTCLNTVFVPFIAWMLYKKKPSKKCYIALPIALAGMAVLTNLFGAAFVIGTGDLYSIIGALFFAITLVIVGDMAEKGNNIKIMLFMLAFWKMAGGALMFGIEEKFSLPSVNWLYPVLIFIWMGVFCSFVATSSQVSGQKYTSETVTVMILALESVFAAIISVIVGFDAFSLSLVFGGLLIMAATFILVYDFPAVNYKNTFLQ